MAQLLGDKNWDLSMVIIKVENKRKKNKRLQCAKQKTTTSRVTLLCYLKNTFLITFRGNVF